MTDADHEALAAALRSTKAMVLLSGYRCDLYARLYDGWSFVEKATFADGAAPRVEVLWFNHAAAAALSRTRAQGSLDFRP